jgi:site-specific DNA recombinase
MAPKLTALAAQRARLVPLVIVGIAERSVAYGRVSTELQKEDETINGQKTVLLKDITIRDDPSLPIAQQRRLVGQFWDDGVSGTVPLEQRPEGRKLVAMVCERGNIRCKGECNTPQQIDVVWATKLDRLARTLQILIEVEAFLRNHGVKLRVLEHNIDTTTPMGIMIFTILGAIAQWEREVILERTASGRKQKASEGKFVGGRRTFGLKTDKNGYLIVDDALVAGTSEMAYKIVQQIFDNVVNHGSSAFREAQRWGMTDRRVQSILHNPRYKGEGGMVSGGTEWIAAEKNPPPTIVAPETWELAQGILLENRKNSSRNRHYDYLLTRLLVCCEPHEHKPVVDDNGVTWGRPVKISGLCGRTFSGRVEKRHNYRDIYVYYCCSRGADCTARMLRGNETENAVWEVVDQTLRNPKKALATALDRRNQEETLRQVRTEMGVVVEALTRLDAERERVIRNGEKGHRSEADVDQRVAEIEAEAAPLHEQKKALEVQFRSAMQTSTNIDVAALNATATSAQLDQINALCASSNPEEVRKGRQRKAAILHTVINRIEVRNSAEERPTLRLFLRIGGSVGIDLSRFQESSDNPQLQSQDPSKLARVGATYAEDNAQPEQEEFVIVREISLPSRKGSAA